MNRADKAREYLSERLTQFVNFKNMSDSKHSFFDSIMEFRETIIPGLAKFKIFESKGIDELDRLLSGMEVYRGKGGYDLKVYHSTWDGFGKIQAKINELVAFTEKVHIPWRYRMKDIISSKVFLIPVGCVFLAAIIQLILYFFIFGNL